MVELARDDGEPARSAGPLAELVVGQRVRIVGQWREHPRYGWTFEATFYEQLTPTTARGLESFLRSERFAEVDEQVVSRVVATFGADAGPVIAEEPDRLAEEADIPPAAAARLHRGWLAGRSLAELVRLAGPASVPMRAVRAVHARFGARSVEVVRTDPYQLLDVAGCTFEHADALAARLGVDPHDERRLAAGGYATVRLARRRDGHEYLLPRQAQRAAAGMLEVDPEVADRSLQHAVERELLVRDGLPGGDAPAVYTPQALRTERRLAADITRLLDARSRVRPHRDAVSPPEELTTDQVAAARAALASPVTVVTGGPGTGKTRAVAEMVRAAQDAELTVGLCAPTGRAATRLGELVGHPASTIHRLLEARPLPGGDFAFHYGPDQRLPLDLVVCDEVSMCDTELAAQLIGAVDDGAHLALVGDPDQLPPVGPGDLLPELLACEAVPTTVLTEMHRQAADSRIVSLAREINAGEVGGLSGNDGGEVFLAEEPRRRAITPRVVRTVAHRGPEYFDVDVGEIQVLAPVYGGPAGVDALNEALKAELNPAEDQVDLAGMQVGDRVMQTRNDADREISNGDIGTVVDVDRGGGELRVAFPRGEVTYTRDQARELTHAWAVTVHKSQGGEWPVVVMVVDRSHAGMLWRNLVYTAATRATRALIIVGQEAALRAAASRDGPRERNTALAARIARACEEEGVLP